MSPSRKPGRSLAPGSHSAPGPSFSAGGIAPGYVDVPTATYALSQFVPDLGSGSHMMPTQFQDLKFQDLDVLSAPHPPLVQRRNSLDGDFCGPCSLNSGCLNSLGKLSALDSGSYLPFKYGPNVGAAPSVSMSSHSSTVSRRSSGLSTLSSIQTEIPQQQQKSDYMAGDSSWSRGPSPLGNYFNVNTLPSPSELSDSTMRAKGNDGWQPVHGDGGRFPPSKCPDGCSQPIHQHVCHWNDNGPCKSGGFATKEELNWHVKAVHLLVCPVLGCTEGSFANESLVDCHIRWVHKNSGSTEAHGMRQSSNLLESVVRKRSAPPEKHIERKFSSSAHDKAEEKRVKMELSVATSKKRCREQLRNVAERKLKRVGGKSFTPTFEPQVGAHSDPVPGASPRSIESPGTMNSRASRIIESVSFAVIWEHGVLPFLVELMPKWCGPGHVISVMRGRKRDSRRVCFLTAKPISKARKILIASHVRDLLPENHKGNVSFLFSVGDVDRLTWARGLSKNMPDEVCDPRNPFCYISPQMGDSIGMTLPDGDDVSATLGPCVKIQDVPFWLVNHHPFMEASLSVEPATIEHPSPADRKLCLNERHDALDVPGLDFDLGKLTATSGYDLKTTRVTHDPYWQDCDKEPPLMVTDWALVTAKSQQANLMRKLPSTAAPGRETPITRMSSIVPGVDVCSTGRTSGHQRGQVCEVPAYIDGKRNGTGKATREWFIEEPHADDNEEAWISGGIGVPGDSGAAVIDCETNTLIGQLWGRNRYFGPGPRVTYFSPIFDVFDDIQEKCGEQTRPRLPQYRDEADSWPVYPICRPCFDRQECMASRRSSHASIMSMIPGAGIPGEKEHDLTSVSELATPKEAGDQLYWIRHIGAEEIGGSASSSFNNGVSPTPAMSTFFYNPRVSSPRPSVLEMRSPYAVELNEDDLHDSVADVGFSGLGKRTANAAALLRSVSQQSAKRRRMM